MTFFRRMLPIACSLTWLASSVQADWPYQATRDCFTFHADFPLDPNQRLMGDLAQIKEELCATLRLPDQGESIDVYLFGDRATYELYLKRYFAGVTPRRAMFIKSNSPGNVFAYVSPEFDIDLRHEATHALLHARLPMVPLWLDEGLAEYFEVAATARAREHPYLKAVRRRTNWQRPPSLERLESFTHIGQMGPDEYRDAWSWVHFMLHGPPEAQQALRHYFAQVARHEPPTPLSVALANCFESPQRAYAGHFRSWR